MRLDEKIALEKEEAAEKAAKEAMIKVAKALKVKGFPIEEIITLTDLTPEEIEKL